MKCNKCEHFKVCGHKDSMKRAIDAIEKVEIEKGEFVKIDVSCTQYKESAIINNIGFKADEMRE